MEGEKNDCLGGEGRVHADGSKISNSNTSSSSVHVVCLLGHMTSFGRLFLPLFSNVLNEYGVADGPF